MAKSASRERIPWPPLENLRARNYNAILECLESLLLPVLNTDNKLSADDANSLCIFVIKFLVESVSALSECVGKVPSALLASIIICCHVYLVLKDHLTTKVDALTVPKAMYHILSKLTPEISFHTHLLLGNLMLDVMERTDSRTEGVAGTIISNSYSLLWNNALRFESLEITSPLQLCQLRFLALRFLIMKLDDLETVFQKAGMVLSVFGSKVKGWWQTGKQKVPGAYHDDMKACLKFIEIPDKMTKRTKVDRSRLWRSSFGTNSCLELDVMSAISLSEKFLSESLSVGTVQRKTLLHFVLSQFRLLFFNGLLNEIPNFISSLRDAVSMCISFMDDETSRFLDRLSCISSVMCNVPQKKLDEEITHYFTAVQQWAEEVFNNPFPCDIHQFSMEVFRLLVRQLKTFTLKQKVILTMLQYQVLMSIVRKIQMLLDADIGQNKLNGLRNDAQAKEELLLSQKSLLEAHRAWFILMYWAVHEDSGFAKEFHQRVLNQMDESINCYMTAINSVSCLELKTGEYFYFGCMAVKLGHYFYDKQCDSLSAKLYKVACTSLVRWCREGSGDMKTRMQEVSLLKVYDCAVECDRRCGCYVQARETVVQAFVLNEGYDIQENPAIISLIKTWVKITRQGWKEDQKEIYENCLGACLRECKDYTFSHEHLFAVLREELHVLEAMNPRIYQAEMAVLRAMEDISKDPSEKSSILLAIIKTVRVLKEQKVAWLITWADKKIAELASFSNCHLLKGQVVLWHHITTLENSTFTKRSKSTPEEVNVGKCASTDQKEATLKNSALKSGSIHHPCCLSDLEKTMKLMSCIKDHWEQGMTALEGSKMKDRMTTRWLLNDVLLCADLLKCHCQYQQELEFLAMAYKFADLISDDSYKVKVSTAILQVLAAQGVSELPCKCLVHSGTEQSTKDRDKLANTLQLANFYLKAGQPRKTADLLKDKHLRKDCQSDASLRGTLSRITGECLLLPVVTRGEGVGMEGGEYAIGHLMDAVRCHSTALHRLLGNNTLQTLAKAEVSFQDPAIWSALPESLESLFALGRAYIHIGDTRRARCYLREALKLSVHQGLVKWAAQCSLELGRVYILDETPLRSLSSLALSVACLNNHEENKVCLETIADILKESENLEFCRLGLDDLYNEDSNKSENENMEEEEVCSNEMQTAKTQNQNKNPSPTLKVALAGDLVQAVEAINCVLDHKWKHLKDHGVHCSSIFCKDDGSLIHILISQVLLLHSISKQLPVDGEKSQSLMDMLISMDQKQKSMHTCSVCHQLLKKCGMLTDGPTCLQTTACSVLTLQVSLDVFIARVEMLRDNNCPELVVQEGQPYVKMLEHLGRDFAQITISRAKLHYLMACALVCCLMGGVPKEPSVYCGIWRSKENLKEAVSMKLNAILSRLATSGVPKDEKECDNKSQEAKDACTKSPVTVEIVTSLLECRTEKKQGESLPETAKKKDKSATSTSTRARSTRRKICEKVPSQREDAETLVASPTKDKNCSTEVLCQPFSCKSNVSEMCTTNLSSVTTKQTTTNLRNRLRLTKIPIPQESSSKHENMLVSSDGRTNQAIESVSGNREIISKEKLFQSEGNESKQVSKKNTCVCTSRTGGRKAVKPKKNVTECANLFDRKTNVSRCDSKNGASDCGNLLNRRQTNHFSTGDRDNSDVFDFAEEDECFDKPVKSKRKVSQPTAKGCTKNGIGKSFSAESSMSSSPSMQTKAKGRLRNRASRITKPKSSQKKDKSQSPTPLDMSMELPRAVSDNENNSCAASRTTRRRGGLSTRCYQRDKGNKEEFSTASLQVEVQEDKSTEILTHLQKAQALLHHFPPVKLYQSICKLLASRMLDHFPSPSATTLLLESSSVTLRHLFLTNFHRQLRLWQKEKGPDIPLDDKEVTMLQSARDDIAFPWTPNTVTDILAEIPEGWTVCQFSVVEAPAPAYHDTLLLTRLSRSHAPFTVALNSFSGSMGESVMKEFQDIMQQLNEKHHKKDCDKMEWWSGRVELDLRLQDVVEVIEKEWLGPWRCLLRASCSDSEFRKTKIRQQTYVEEHIMKILGSDHQIDIELLLEVSLYPEDDQHLPTILSHMLHMDCSNPKVKELIDVVTQARPSVAPQHSSPIILILDRYLHTLPWENLPVVSCQQVCRMPSLASLHVLLKHFGHKQHHYVQPDKVFYVIDPDNNLPNTRQVFENLFRQQTNWNGIVGRKPSVEEYSSALTSSDVFVYSGHGSGVQYFSGDSIQQLKVRATSLLMGCSSVRLNIRSILDPDGNIFNYILSRCPSVVGTLWDVTDRDIDRFLSTLLGPYLNNKNEVGTCKPLPLLVCNARSACLMRYLVGASTVVYGLPVLFVSQ